MDDRPEWFAPQRYGIGTGLPIAWQGWALLVGFIVLAFAIGYFLDGKPSVQAAILFPAVAMFLVIVVRTTKGGWRWRWRWGEHE